MAIKNIKVSDITGADLKPADTMRVVVKNHPELDGGRQIDAAIHELENLKVMGNLVTVEMHYPDGTSNEVAVTVAELHKVIPLPVLENADGLRGRRRGYSPSHDL